MGIPDGHAPLEPASDVAAPGGPRTSLDGDFDSAIGAAFLDDTSDVAVAADVSECSWTRRRPRRS